MLKASPLKHKEKVPERLGAHDTLTLEEHDEMHANDLPELKDLTIYNTDNPKPPKSIEQAKVEKKSTDAKLENNTNDSFFPNQIEPSVQDNTNQVQPTHLADPTGEAYNKKLENVKEEFWGDTNRDDYKRKNNKWYLVKDGEETEVGADPKTAGKKQTALLNNLNQSLWGGEKEIDPNDPQTWVKKEEKTIAAGLRASNAHPGIIVDDKSQDQLVIKLPNSKTIRTKADDPNSVKKYQVW